MDILKRSTSKLSTKQATQREALARQNARSDRVCLDFSLVTLSRAYLFFYCLDECFAFLCIKAKKVTNVFLVSISSL